MPLTISTTHWPAADWGYLLQRHSGATGAHVFELTIAGVFIHCRDASIAASEGSLSFEWGDRAV